MNLREIAEARDALALRLREGLMPSFSEDYRKESAALDQSAAAERLRLDAEATERHEKQVASAIAANQAIAENQGKLSALLQVAEKVTVQNADSVAVLRELVQAVRDASIMSALGRLWKSVKK